MQPTSMELKFSKAQPVLILVICVGLSIFSWWYFTNQHQKDVKLNLSKQTEVFARYIVNDVDTRLPALKRIVLRWEHQGSMNKDAFVADAANYITDNPGIQAIEWVDGTYHIRWVVPLKGNEKAENLFLGFEERRLKALEKAKAISTATMSKPITLVQGGTGILVYFPINVKNDFSGFLLVVFNTEKWIDFLFRDDRHSDVIKDFDVSVKLAGEKIFETSTYPDNKDTKRLTTYNDTILNHPLVVSIKPTQHYSVQRSNYTAELVMAAFVLFGAILACLSYFLKKASTASLQMQKSLVALDLESTERKRAEEDANQANLAKTKFLTAMSHEIRTPLNAVLGVLQLLGKKDLSDDVVEKLKIAHQSGHFLLTLVNQILDFARIEAGAVEKSEEDFVIGELIANLFSMFKMQAEKKQLQFDYRIIGPEDKCVTGDYNHIRQILFNLIGNALKFTDKGAVTVIVKVIDAANDVVKLSFEVMDTGNGISQEEQEIIFEEFKQSETGRKSGLGSGLGLSISKQLAEFMGGQLFVTSSVGHGTTFTFLTEVMVSEAQLNIRLTDKMQTDLPQLRILVAEDNSINQMIIEEMLVGDGHLVTIVEDGSLAVREIQNSTVGYDLVLMDIQMPVMNGVEATKAIRTIIPDPEKLPIFALTANVFKSQIEEYLSAGMQATLTKPIILNDLRTMLIRYFLLRENEETAEKAGLKSADISHDVKFLDETIFMELKNSVSADVMDRVLSKFQVNFAELMEKIQIDDIKPETVASLAHEISGMVSNVGLVELANKAKEIEHLAKSGHDTYDLRCSLETIADFSLKELSSFVISNIDSEATVANL